MIKLLKRLRVGLSHLKEHKCKPNFPDSVDAWTSYGDSIETTIHFSPLRISYVSNSDPLEQNTFYWSKYLGIERKFCY